MAAQTSQLNEALSGIKPDDLTTIIDRLAGDKDNLKVDIQHLKFKVKNQQIELNGLINFKVYHKDPNAHQAVKEETKNR